MTKAFIIFSFPFFFLSLSVTPMSAQSPSLINSVTRTSTPKTVDYNLAYPGILSNHPLYKLKILRDKITERLISDPSKKIDFYLLQTDKMILASSILVEKGEIEPAKETALKGENNYTLITYEFKNINKKPNQKIYNKLKMAAKKHQEILNIIIGKVKENDKETFKNVLYFSQINLKEIERLYKNKKLEEI